MLRSAWRLRRLLTERRPDVVHANGIKAAVICVAATLGTGIPVLWVKHDFSWDGWLANVTARACDEIVGVSAAVVEPLGRRFATKIHVISPGVPDFRIERGSARLVVLEELGVDANAVLVAMVARLDPYKGHRELIEIAPAMLERLPALHFLVVGADANAHADYRDALIRRAEELGVRASFTFMGHRDDAVTIMAGADLVVVPSVGRRGMGREGFGLVPLEALAVGTPVVAYADGALPEVLGHDAARLVPARDRGRLAAAIVEVLTDAALRRRLTSAGRARVRERYGVSATVERMKERYRATAAGRA
jgi:glycosyltransferase involved in cell wall biosynthesis